MRPRGRRAPSRSSASARAPVKLRVFTPEHSRDGWSSPLTVIETVLEDRPFIVDTVRELLQADGGEIRLLLHPISASSATRTAACAASPARIPDCPSNRSSTSRSPTSPPPPHCSGGWRNASTTCSRSPTTTPRCARACRTSSPACARRRCRGRGTPSAKSPPRSSNGLSHKSFVFLGYREYALERRRRGARHRARPHRSRPAARSVGARAGSAARNFRPRLRRSSAARRWC